MNLWAAVRHLFEVDDGMLPDIYVENLHDEEVVRVYEWVMSQCEVAHSPTLWSKEQERDLPIKGIHYPAREFINGRVESFRHCLEGLFIDSVVLPELSIMVEKGRLSFDYRSGNEWSEEEVRALFEFLCSLKKQAPNARIFQADEGCYSAPSIEFSKALANFESASSNKSVKAKKPSRGT